jgi:trimeric autotransporter adhesin
LQVAAVRRLSSSFVGANVTSCSGAAAWLADWARTEGLEVETLPWGAAPGGGGGDGSASTRMVTVTVRANDGLSGTEALLAAAPLPPSSFAAAGAPVDEAAGAALAVTPPPVPHGAFLLAGVAASLAGGGAPWLGKDAVFVWACDGHSDSTAGTSATTPAPAAAAVFPSLRSYLDRYHYDPSARIRHHHGTAAVPADEGVGGGGTALARLARTLQRLLSRVADASSGSGSGARAAASSPRHHRHHSRPPPPQPPLAHHSGPLRAGLFLDLPPLPAGHAAGATHAAVHVLPHGARGRLPELDYYTLVASTYATFGVDVVPRRGTFPAAEAARRRGHALVQSPWGARALALLTARVARARAQLTGGPVVPFTQAAAGAYVDRLADVASFAHALLWPATAAVAAAGRLPPHAEMLQHGIHAVTVTAAATAASTAAAAGRDVPTSTTHAPSAAAADDSLLRHGRAVERVLRGMSTTDERLHASHYFYLLLSPQAFVGINEYAIPFGLAHAPLLVLTATAIISGRQLAAALLAWWAAAATGAAWFAALFADGAGVEAALAEASPEAVAAVVAVGIVLQLAAAAAVTVVLRRTVLRRGGSAANHESAAAKAAVSSSPPPPSPPASPRAPSDRFAWVFTAWMAFGLPQFAMLYALYPLADGHALLMVPVLAAFSLAPWRAAGGSVAADTKGGGITPVRPGSALGTALSVLVGAAARALRLAALVALPVGVPLWLGAGAPPPVGVRPADLAASAAGLLHGAVALAPHGGIMLPWLLLAWAPPLALLLASELL